MTQSTPNGYRVIERSAELKDAARQLLLNQGIGLRDIPWELRPKDMAEDYQQMVADTVEAEGPWGWDMQSLRRKTS